MAPALKRQQGFALLELAVAAALATLLVVWAAQSGVHRVNDLRAQSLAVWMASAQRAMQRYLQVHGAALRQSAGASELVAQGFANGSRPTLDELRTQGFLNQGFPLGHALVSGLNLLVLRSGECPGSACRLEALVYASSALTDGLASESADSLQAQWLMAAQGLGGGVTASRPDYVAGAGFSFSNPPATDMSVLPVGTVAMAVTLDQTAGQDFLRVGDDRDPDFQGGVSVQGAVSSQTGLRTQGGLWLGRQAAVRTFCEEIGEVAREAYGGLLVCRSYRWSSAGGLGSGGYSVNSRNGCTPDGTNPVTGACSCPSGSSTVRIADSGDPAGPSGLTRGYLCVG